MRLKLSLGNKNLVNRRCGWHSLVSGSSLSSFFLLTYLDRIAGTGTHDNSAALCSQGPHMANLILINHKGRQFRKVPFFRPSQLSRASLSPTHRFTIHGSTVGTYELRKKEKRKKKVPS
ncbi:NADH-ubiquinone oxidoreductase 21.3 kDa subunit [Fusarium oxysporum f. sp. albedinis]|nr:NADH-ubiquinone oxidoreductase 21.3 kDa subunit [Fusarium oxysporum f. sp. albedinis]